MHGHGVYIWNDNRKYEGEYLIDKKHAFGIYYWPDGRVYEGYWLNGKQHGLGIYKTPDQGEVRFGLWENGKRIWWFDKQEVEQI